MRGEKVIVKAYGNKPLVRLVWSINSAVVFVTDNTGYRLMETESEATSIIGFPQEDVFKYDPALEKIIGQPTWNWDELTPYES